MKPYDIEVQRLKSMKHDKGLIEINIDALVMSRQMRDDQSATSCLRLPTSCSRAAAVQGAAEAQVAIIGFSLHGAVRCGAVW